MTCFSRWFVGLGIEDPVWDATTFTKNRDRLHRKTSKDHRWKYFLYFSSRYAPSAVLSALGRHQCSPMRGRTAPARFRHPSSD
jgi:hypothetical protein